MNKWFGEIGFVGTVETSPGVFVEQITDKCHYFGDIIQTYSKASAPSKVVDDMTVTTKISVLSNEFGFVNIHRMKYAEYLGTRWAIATVEPHYPRLILTLGGLYTEND